MFVSACVNYNNILAAACTHALRWGGEGPSGAYISSLSVEAKSLHPWHSFLSPLLHPSFPFRPLLIHWYNEGGGAGFRVLTVQYV